MVRIADAIGRVMMGIGTKPTGSDAALKTWAETEYRKDSKYAYEMLKSGKLPDLR